MLSLFFFFSIFSKIFFLLTENKKNYFLTLSTNSKLLKEVLVVKIP
jgi:hypothetical protein